MWEEEIDQRWIELWVWVRHADFASWIVCAETEFDSDDWSVGGLAEAIELGFEITEELGGFFVIMMIGWDIGEHEDTSADGFVVVFPVSVVFLFEGDLAGLGFVDVLIPSIADFFVDWPCFLFFGVGCAHCVDGERVVLSDVGLSDEEAGGESGVGDEDEEDDGGDGAADVAEGAPVEGAFAFGGAAEEFGDFLRVSKGLGDLVWGASGLECVLGVGDEFLGDVDAFGFPELCFADGGVDECAELLGEVRIVEECVGLDVGVAAMEDPAGEVEEGGVFDGPVPEVCDGGMVVVAVVVVFVAHAETPIDPPAGLPSGFPGRMPRLVIAPVSFFHASRSARSFFFPLVVRL